MSKLLYSPTVSQVSYELKDARSVGGRKQVAELIVLNLTRAVLVDILDKFLNVDGHFELVLDYIDELLRVDWAISILLATHGDEGV